jgi:hypothetical protein
MFTRTLLVIMVLGLYNLCQANASVATRTGTIARQAIKTIQQNGPQIQSKLEMSQMAFQKLKAAHKYFQRIKEIIKKKKEDNPQSEDTNTSELMALNNQIQECVPDNAKEEKCYSPCAKDHSKYRWCYTSSERRASQWESCSCTIKRDILKYLAVSRQNLLMTPPTPWTLLEITMVVIASSLGAILALGGAIVGYYYFRRTQEDPFQVQGNVFPNPVYHPENDQ